LGKKRKKRKGEERALAYFKRREASTGGVGRRKRDMFILVKE